MSVSNWSSIIEKELGQSVSDKFDSAFSNIDTKFDEVSLSIIDAISLTNMTPSFGVDIDTITQDGYYEVDSNIPLGDSGELRVGHEVGNETKIIQEYMDSLSPLVYRRISSNGGTNWSVWVDSPQSVFNNYVIEKLEDVATREYVNNSIVNTYSGTTEPSPTLGKSGDTYHQYASAVSTVIQSGISIGEYNSGLFDIFFDDVETDGLYSISIKPSSRTVFIDWRKASSHSDNYALKINGTTIPLTIDINTQTTVAASYDSGYDTVIQAITSSSPFELSTDILSGSDVDYTKFAGSWYVTPVFSALFEYSKIGAIGSPAIPTVSNTSFAEANRLVLPNMDVGTYIVKYMSTFSMASTGQSFIFKYGQKLGAGSFEYETRRKEVKDITDKPNYDFEYIHEHNGGDLTLTIDVAVEGNHGALYFQTILVERKK